ncbi:hypothetical protein SAMN04487895_12742 [Paenibacillus sophorae]|uniref:Uncharacterized protein n=1 Tax=Paenibacillus sophorae TaxID=1333845 RepID=A0A1H8VTB9_9BACL|nr:hypothetical protein [Paenibacillus sophorae]QWU15694.1 hypothetical protein KP014_28425 [Paenibacillus sophorae]SEP18543.1 hypothetical protein SAMN04487895_12742 [Paenibacillus sophorae]
MVDLIILIFAVIGSVTVGAYAGVLILGGQIYVRIGNESNKTAALKELGANQILATELAEAHVREGRLKGAAAAALSWTWNCAEGNMLEVRAALSEVLEELYPGEHL